MAIKKKLLVRVLVILSAASIGILKKIHKKYLFEIHHADDNKFILTLEVLLKIVKLF